jgi:hypothetical protein
MISKLILIFTHLDGGKNVQMVVGLLSKDRRKKFQNWGIVSTCGQMSKEIIDSEGSGPPLCAHEVGALFKGMSPSCLLFSYMELIFRQGFTGF